MKHCVVILIICFTSISFAQKAQNIYFLTNDGKKVSTIDSADFMRVIREPDSDKTNFELFEYYQNEKLKRVGYVSSFDPTIILEGYVREYYQNGKRKEISNYVRNVKSGESTLFFENGVIEEVINYSIPPNKIGTLVSEHTDFSNNDYAVKYYGDSAGKSFLDSNETGSFKTVNRNGDLMSGAYLNGLKNGYWETVSKDDGAITQESFENSKFIKGVRKEKSGFIKEYLQQEILPQFPGGLAGFNKYIQRNFHYPSNAQRQGVSGIIIISFVIDIDGSVTNIKILRDKGFGTGAEAERIMASSPKWLPDLQNGKPVRVSYTLPINLTVKVYTIETTGF